MSAFMCVTCDEKELVDNVGEEASVISVLISLNH